MGKGRRKQKAKSRNFFFMMDNGIWVKPKASQMSAEAFRRWIFLLAFSSTMRTEGVIDQSALDKCCVKEPEIEELLKFGYLRRVPYGNFHIVDYDQWQMTDAKRKSFSDWGRLGAQKRWASPEELEDAGGPASDEDDVPFFDTERNT